MSTKSKIKELVVISGKGGTGKTSITAAFAVLAQGRAVLADCDVDAADLHLVLPPDISKIHDFYSGREAVIRESECVGCGDCLELCRFAAVERVKEADGQKRYTIDPLACEGCGVCVRFCPVEAIEFPDSLCGEWMLSATRCGSMVHAQLHTGAENSGKLVAAVRSEARQVAERQGKTVIITDGPPGIGCPVIAAITGADQLLVVTEPTVSGEHDLKRVLQLAEHFKMSAAVCVNKWDINREATERIERMALAMGAQLVGRIRHDKSVTAAQVVGKSVVEMAAAAGDDIRAIFEKLQI